MNVTYSTRGRLPTNRFRLPGIEREGIAQLSLLETALWPLRQDVCQSSTYATTYSFRTDGRQRIADVRVFAPLGLQSIDEFVLYGLLGISLDPSNPQPCLLAPPYWIMKRLGMDVGGFQYDQLRASLERLALTAYQNTGFWNPLTQQHERVTFHFLSSFIPKNSQTDDVDTGRSWRIEWDKHFFDMCCATGGSLLFDLDLYRQLSPASRRLFLKLKDRFWRTKRVFMNVDDLTINGLGCSSERPLKKRKYQLTKCIRELLDFKIIELGRGQDNPSELFIRRAKGLYVVVFYEGEYFRTPAFKRVTSQKNAIADDPLYDPLRRIGVDGPAIHRIFKKHSRGRIQRWIRITEAAIHEKPRAFPGFKVSPAAFFIDGLEHNRTPPDWIYAHEKRQEQRKLEEEQACMESIDRELRQQYDRERLQALKAFIQSPDGTLQYQRAYEGFLELYQRIEPDRYREAAADAAMGKVEREHFSFPEFGVWVLNRAPTS